MNGTINAADVKLLCANRQWVLGINNQVLTSCGIGLCDSVLCNFIRGAEAWAYDTCLVNWTMGPPAAPTNTSGDPLETAAGTEYDLFSQAGGGVGSTIVGGWFAKGLNRTDLLDGGTPVDRGFVMVLAGAAVRVGLPFQRGGSQTTATDPLFHTDWLTGVGMSGDGPNYSERLQTLTLEATSLRLKLGDAGIQYYLGSSYVYPSSFGAFGQNLDTNGIVNIPGAYTPFMVALAIGSQFDLRRASVLMTVDDNMEIESNATTPTDPVAVDGEPGSGTVYVPYQLFLFGYVCCFDTASYCGGLTISESEAVRRFLQSQGALPAPGPV